MPDVVKEQAAVEQAFDQFFTAVTCKSILSSFHQLLDVTGLRHADHRTFYAQLKEKLKSSWKAQSLWAKLDKRASHRDYGRGKICADTNVLIIGAGPCGLRTAIECAFLGARTVIVEKRDRFSRNNVLHLWPYLITDLKNLGAKMFFGKFCAGAIDHISIRQLQCILLKVALLVGVEVHVCVGFDGLIEPPEDQSTNVGWRCKCSPADHPVSEYQFDVLIGADGKRNTLSGFKRKEFRGKLAIAITANFINRNSNAEARVEEISGVAFIFNQKFFLDLKEKTGIDLENIVYYKDDTHYFVMTAKKQSLLEKGVLKEDHADTIALLDRSNVNQDALMAYAREAADFSTNHQLPTLDYAVNHYGQADVAMFDFTSMFAAENASRILEKHNHRLVMGLVGDSLLEPFWPTGSGCARGFLGAFDAAWMIRSWSLGRMTPLEVIAERESIYTVLSQTTPQRLHKNHHQYSIDPNTRYPNLNVNCVKPKQVLHLYDGVVDPKELEEGPTEVPAKRPRNVNANEYNIDSYSLLRWCQRVLNTGMYRGVHIVDFTSSWRSGLAFCALIHAFRPELINTNSLMESEVVKNNQQAFETAQRELGIAPVMTAEDMASCAVPDKLTMVAYLSQFYELFKHEPLPSSIPLRPKAKPQTKDEGPKTPRSPNRRISLLNRISARINKSKKRKEKEEPEPEHLGWKKLKDGQTRTVELTKYSKLPMEEIANKLTVDKVGAPPGNAKRGQGAEAGSVSVAAMADVLVAKFKCNEDQPAPPPIRRMKGQPVLLAAQSASEFCYFCKKRVYIMERLGAEGVFFHRHCLKCDFCGVGLRINNYSCERPPGEGVKFYCYRHAIPEMRNRPRRKRNLESADDVKENIPATVITPAEEMEVESTNDVTTTPKKIIPAPLQVPGEPKEKAKKTPERIEFEISFDGQEEESEEEQFEHNLRASMSSDTMLDNSDEDEEDSDGESSTEDDLWESAGPGSSAFTWEEAVKLASTWKRQHSTENLLEAVEQDAKHPRHSRHDAYTRLRNGEDAEDEDDDDDEGSSTEVEDSEYETDSSADELTEEESERTRGGGSTADTLEGGGTEDSAATTTSPSSPAVKSAARASFFSAPPTVVRLDPWRMFNKGKNESVEETVEANVVDANDEAVEAISEAADEGVMGRDEDNKSTDVSESLEMDSRGEEGRGSSIDGSLEDLAEGRSDEVLVDIAEEDMAASGDGEEEKARKGQNGELAEEVEMLDDDEEELEKTAVSMAMERLLADIDHKSSEGGTDSIADLDISVPSDNEEVFQTGKDMNRDAGDEKAGDEKPGSVSEDTTESVLRSVREMGDTNTLSGEDTLRQVLEDVAALSDLSDAEQAPPTPQDAEQFKNLDERFITDRKKPRKKRGENMSRSGSESSLTISTPSESLSSSSSSLDDMVKENERFIATDDVEDDLRPDKDMMREYMTTMSLVLDESYSDAEADNSLTERSKSSPTDDMNRTLQGEEEGGAKADADVSADTNTSSLYLTPEVSMEERRASQEGFEDAPSSPLVTMQDVTVGVDLPSTKPEPKKTKDVKPPVKKATSVPSLSGASSGASSGEKNTVGKTVIHVDQGSLWSDSSTDHQGSDSEFRKKKIPVDTSALELSVPEHKPSVVSDIEDIPFADESEADDRFYTPRTSVKPKPEPATQQPQGKTNARKRILPSPPNATDTNPSVPSAEQIHNIKAAEQAKAREFAQDRKWPKADSDQPQGAAFVNPAYGSAAAVLNKRRPGVRGVKDDPRDRRSSSYDTPSTPDVLSDSDDSRQAAAGTSATNTPISSANELDATVVSTKDKKKKTKVPKSAAAAKVKPRSSEERSDGKLKKKKKRSKSKDSLGDAGLSTDIKGLKITSVFDKEGKTEANGSIVPKLVGRPIPIAPKASVDEFSDSDESQVSVNTLLRRKEGVEGVDERVARKLERMAAKQQKQAEQQRLRAAQEIQRRLQEVDERQRELEDRGIAVEKALRGEGPEADVDENQLMGEWFNLVHEKNALVRYESELMVRAKELELEDRQSRLQAQFRECSLKTDTEKTQEEIEAEGHLLDELLDVVEQRNALVAMLEEDRLSPLFDREQEEDRELEDMMDKKGFVLSPLNYSRALKSAPLETAATPT
nr:hypothetical protein BaRGS_028785 [Batillaria attramentaria]